MTEQNNSSNKLGTVAPKYFRLTKAMAMVGGVTLFVMTILVTADVVSRTLANRPLPATLEVTLTLMVFIVFLGLAYTQVRKIHLRLDFIYRKLSPGGQAVMDIFTLLIGIFVVSIIGWESCGQAWDAWSTGEYMEGIWKIPYFPSKIGLALGVFLLWFQYILDLIQSVSRLLSIRNGDL